MNDPAPGQDQRLDEPSRPAERLAAALDRLDAAYGRPTWTSSRPPLDELVATILSQNTSDTNSQRAFAALKAAFPSYTAARDAPHAAVADAIRAGGLAELKASRIQLVLRTLSRDTAAPDLPDLQHPALDDAIAYLTSLPGVGPKTAACVLLFSLGRPALPVDTHVGRVARRLGLIPATMGDAAAHKALAALTPPNDAYRLHVGFIRLGRRTCVARRPRCPQCPLTDICPSAAALSET